jgi:hypothetical protein
MRKMKLVVAAFALVHPSANGQQPIPAVLAKPVESGAWIIPAEGEASQPVWGMKGGVAVGLWPKIGPRGLLRIYAPYLDHPPDRMVNFIAIEPIVNGVRGYSELELSGLDGRHGKAMWTADDFDADPKPRAPWRPARGRITGMGRSQTLTFHLFTERFDNGARVVVKVVLRQDRPYEVSLTTFAAEGCAPMNACVLTATMGNYGRLRDLWLRDEVVRSTLLFRDAKLDEHGFFPPRDWNANRMLTSGGDLVAAAASNEADPARGNEKTMKRSWRYVGKPATHYWKTKADDSRCVVRVNGRRTYWPDKTGGDGPIPGGVSFENFELEAPFRQGQEFRFGVTPEPPESLGFSPKLREKIAGGK